MTYFFFVKTPNWYFQMRWFCVVKPALSRPSRMSFKWFQPENLEDIYLRQAPDDQDYREVVYGSYYYGGVMMGFLLLFGIPLIIQGRRKRNQ